MEKFIDASRAATAANASAASRAAGAHACRTLLAALEAKPGEPLTSQPTAARPLQAIVSMLRAMPSEQFLDLAIAKLKAAPPAGTDVSAVEAVRIPLAPITLGGRR